MGHFVIERFKVLSYVVIDGRNYCQTISQYYNGVEFRQSIYGARFYSDLSEAYAVIDELSEGDCEHNFRVLVSQ